MWVSSSHIEQTAKPRTDKSNGRDTMSYFYIRVTYRPNKLKNKTEESFPLVLPSLTLKQKNLEDSNTSGDPRRLLLWIYVPQLHPDGDRTEQKVPCLMRMWVVGNHPTIAGL